MPPRSPLSPIPTGHAVPTRCCAGAEYLNSPVLKSANAKLNGRMLAKKLRLQMARVRDLINAYQAAQALVGAAQAAGSANLGQGAKVFGP